MRLLVVLAHLTCISHSRRGRTNVLRSQGLADVAPNDYSDHQVNANGYQSMKPLANFLFATTPGIGIQRQLPRMQTREQSRRLTPEMNMLRKVAASAGAISLATILSLGIVDPAEAARTGGRVGGRAPRAPVSRSAPRASSSRTYNNYAAPRTNVYVSPGVSVFPGGGYGYGGYGGYGYGGGFGLTTGQYLGITLVDTFIREQQRQQYLQQQLRIQQELGKDQAMIAQLQSELAQQNSKVNDLRKESPDVEKEAMAKLLQDQQKEIQELKAGATR